MKGQKTLAPCLLQPGRHFQFPVGPPPVRPRYPRHLGNSILALAGDDLLAPINSDHDFCDRVVDRYDQVAADHDHERVSRDCDLTAHDDLDVDHVALDLSGKQRRLFLIMLGRLLNFHCHLYFSCLPQSFLRTRIILLRIKKKFLS